MHDIVVVSKRDGATPPPAGYTVIDITRTGSIGLGNEAKLVAKDNMAARLKSLSDHRELVKADFQVKGPMYQTLKSLGVRFKNGENFALLCWCAPLPCHGELYRRLIYRFAGIPLPAEYAPRETILEEESPQQSLF